MRIQESKEKGNLRNIDTPKPTPKPAPQKSPKCKCEHCKCGKSKEV